MSEKILQYNNLAKFKVGVDNVIFSVDTKHNRLLVLLYKRSKQPFKDTWSLPGTLVRHGETLQAAAYRTLAEKITVDNLYLEQLYTFDDPDKNIKENHKYLSITYFALVRYEEAKIINNPNYNLAWYQVAKVPKLAFNHGKILEYGYVRLKNKLEYSPIAFDVLPNKFTLNDLYQFYCTILGENFADYSNFRSRLLKLGFLLDTGKKVSRGAGRPASLYTFDPVAFMPLKDKPFVFI